MLKDTIGVSMITFRIKKRFDICFQLMKKYNKENLRYLLYKYPEWNTVSCCAIWRPSLSDEPHQYLPIGLFNLLSGRVEKGDGLIYKKYNSFDTAMIYYTKALKKYIRSGK